jgi:ornithine cyclodeaminase/alanine dehydrogenase-like protein (mu-crystallin family)
MAPTLLLSRTDLERALDFPSVLSRLEQAFHVERRREWDVPRRITAHTHAGGLLAMPCGGGVPEALGAKLVTVFPRNSAAGLPTISGLYALFDPAMGAPVAVMDGAYLTLVRTAAVSALATRLLSRADSRTLGILGAGAQAAFHARFVAAVRPIDTVRIWARREESARALAASLEAHADLRDVRSWIVCHHPEEAAASDIVVTATAATQPVLEGRWLRPGAHVNPIGAHTRRTREIDTEAVTRAAILAVETLDTLHEAGDFQCAEAEAPGVLPRVQTLGALLDPERTETPRDPEAISIFKSCGVAFEDLVVAALAFEQAGEQGLGSPFLFA